LFEAIDFLDGTSPRPHAGVFGGINEDFCARRFVLLAVYLFFGFAFWFSIFYGKRRNLYGFVR